MSIWRFANPVLFVQLSRKIRKFTDPLAMSSLLIGLVWVWFFIPDDYQQGATIKIFYIHVPSAMIAINAWIMMVIASLVWLIRRHHVSALAAKAAAPVGFVMTLIAVLTGMFWGQPMWGTFWAWDPRLTSFFVLLLFYIGYMALSSVIDDVELSQDMSAILAIVGGIFALLSRYAVNFWNQGLHQGASLSLDAEKHVADVFWYPALVMLFGFTMLFLSLVLYRTETEILSRRLQALRTQKGE